MQVVVDGCTSHLLNAMFLILMTFFHSSDNQDVLALFHNFKMLMKNTVNLIIFTDVFSVVVRVCTESSKDYFSSIKKFAFFKYSFQEVFSLGIFNLVLKNFIKGNLFGEMSFAQARDHSPEILMT